MATPLQPRTCPAQWWRPAFSPATSDMPSPLSGARVISDQSWSPAGYPDSSDNPFTRQLPSVAAVAGAAGGAGSAGGSGAGGGSTANIQTARPGANTQTVHSLTRKRNSFIAGLDNSPVSVESGDYDGAENENQEEEKRHPVKRACNECRQQKLRCDVVQEPFTICSRCRRLGLTCKVQENFKRIGKRSRNAEMEREIIELRKQIAEQNTLPKSNGTAAQKTPQPSPYNMMDQYGSNEAVEGLMGLSGGMNALKRIEDVLVTQDIVSELFNIFFAFYYPYLPFLDPKMVPEDYFEYCPALFWTIISVSARRYAVDSTLLNRLSGPVTRLVWSAMADMKQMFGLVKALCLLCTWPFPTSSTSTDPTSMFCGVMMQISLQIGLHRPSHAQDFSKYLQEFQEDDIKDRIQTWATVTLVSQRVATGYGLPSHTLYDWTLGPNAAKADDNFVIPGIIKDHLCIERFVEKVSSSLYSNRQDPVGLASDEERHTFVNLLASDFSELEESILRDASPVTIIYLRAAHLHLRLAAFFSPPAAQSYTTDLLKLYHATHSLLETCLSLSLSSDSSPPSLLYGSNYIFQMMLAAGFALMKLHSGFIQQAGIDPEGARKLFSRTIWALRGMSVQENDLAQRLAEVLAQVWKGTRAGSLSNGLETPPIHSGIGIGIDSSMQLKVRCRMSVSLVYDSVWRWREEMQRRGGVSLENYLKHPTDPSSVPDSSASSVTANTTNANPSTATNPSHTNTLKDTPLWPTTVPGMPGLMNTPALGLPGTAVGGIAGGGGGGAFNQPNYEVFDPLNWMLDGFVELPFAFGGAGQGFEGAGGMGGMG